MEPDQLMSFRFAARHTQQRGAATLLEQAPFACWLSIPRSETHLCMMWYGYVLV